MNKIRTICLFVVAVILFLCTYSTCYAQKSVSGKQVGAVEDSIRTSQKVDVKAVKALIKNLFQTKEAQQAYFKTTFGGPNVSHSEMRLLGIAILNAGTIALNKKDYATMYQDYNLGLDICELTLAQRPVETTDLDKTCPGSLVYSITPSIALLDNLYRAIREGENKAKFSKTLQAIHHFAKDYATYRDRLKAADKPFTPAMIEHFTQRLKEVIQALELDKKGLYGT